jgi:aminomethyltransferase
MVPFAGYEMPVSYPTGIIQEHLATREAAGLFDISHMCLFLLHGKDVLAFVQSVGTNDSSRLASHCAQYSVLCNENGGAIDDIFVIKLNNDFLFVVNASNADNVAAHLNQQLFDLKVQAPDFDCTIINRHETHAILSFQGPKAKNVVAELISSRKMKLPDGVSSDLNALKRNHCFEALVSIGPKEDLAVLVSRTGYTGGDGFEFYFENSGAEKLWNLLLETGKPFGVLPVGLGARDSLRLEAGLPLYGHEYDENTSPIEAGYPWAVKFNKPAFAGKMALEKKPKKKLVGLELEGQLIARQGFDVFHATAASSTDEPPAGWITSGTFSPKLKKSIALAYLTLPEEINFKYSPEVFARSFPIGTPLLVKIRDQMIAAKVVPLPFFKVV